MNVAVSWLAMHLPVTGVKGYASSSARAITPRGARGSESADRSRNFKGLHVIKCRAWCPASASRRIPEYKSGSSAHRFVSELIKIHVPEVDTIDRFGCFSSKLRF